MEFLSRFRPRVKWVEQAKIVPDSLAQTEFGGAVAIDGNNIAIANLSADVASDRQHTGTVQIYTRSENTWSYQSSLCIPTDISGSYSCFGSSLAIDGNNIAIAADSLHQDNCNTPLFIFTLTGTTWQLAAQLQLPSPPIAPIFYQSIAIDKETVVASTKGTVYIFRYHAQTATWNYQTELKCPQSDFYFGDTVAIDGNTIVVSGGDAGCAWAYVFGCNSATGIWSLQAELIPYEKSLGCSHVVAIAGNAIAIGAPSENRRQGAVYIFELDCRTNQWLPQAQIVPHNVPPFYAYGFGGSLAICNAEGGTLLDRATQTPRDRRTIAIGTTTKTLLDTSLPVWERGGAYIFTRHQRTGKWLQQAQLSPNDYGRVAPTYGAVVALSEQQAIVTTGDNSAVYIFQQLNS